MLLSRRLSRLGIPAAVAGVVVAGMLTAAEAAPSAVRGAEPAAVLPAAYPSGLPLDCPPVPGWRLDADDTQRVLNDTPGSLNWVTCAYVNPYPYESHFVGVTWIWRGAQPSFPPSFGCGRAPASTRSAIGLASSELWEWGEATLDLTDNHPASAADIEIALHQLMSYAAPYAQTCPASSPTTAPTSPPPTGGPSASPHPTPTPTPTPSPTSTPTARPTPSPSAPPFRWRTAVVRLGATSARVGTKVAMSIWFLPASKSAGRVGYVQIKWPGGPWKTVMGVRIGSRGTWGGSISSAARGLLSVRVVLPARSGTPAAVTPVQRIRWR